MNNLIQKLKSQKRYVIVAVVIVALIALRFLLIRQPDSDITYTVKRESLVDTVQVTGTYETASQTEVDAPSNGVITDVFISNHDEVKKGDKLFHIESTATEDEKTTAYSNYTTALNSLNVAKAAAVTNQSKLEQDRAAVISAQSSVDRMNSNIGGSINNPSTGSPYTENDKNVMNSALTSSRETFSADEATYKNNNTTIAAAQAQVNKTQLAYAETQDVTVTAPIDGKVVNFLKRIGDQVKASQKNTNNSGSGTSGDTTSTTTTTSPVLVIENLANPYVSASINEAYMPRLQEGQKVNIVFDSLKSKTFTGIIEALDDAGTDNGGVISYNAQITSNDISDAIKPDMTALLTIETFRKDNVIDVPNTAIIKKNGKSYVQRDNNSKKELVEVSLGDAGLTKIVITSGLSEGDIVVANPSTQ